MIRFLGALTLIALSVLALFMTWPQFAQLELTSPWMQITSMRGLAVAAALVLAVLFGMFRAGATRLKGYFTALTAITTVFVIVNAGIVFSRGVFQGELPRPKAEQVRVLAWNTLGDSVKLEYLARAVDEAKPNVIVLSETTRGHASALATSLLNDLGIEYTVHTVAFDEVYKARSTSVLVAASLGDYRVVETHGNTSVVPSVVLEPVDRGNRPRLVGVHLVSPNLTDNAQWLADFAWLQQICTLPNTVIAGDTNSTADQLMHLSGCSLASLDTRTAAIGTWPATLPPILGAQLDQVLSTPNWRASGFAVLTGEDLSGSDHRPVAAVLTQTKS